MLLIVNQISPVGDRSSSCGSSLGIRMKKSGPDEIGLSKKKTDKTLAAPFTGALPEFRPAASLSCADRAVRISRRGEEVEEVEEMMGWRSKRLEPDDTTNGRFFPPEAISLVVGERLFLVVLRGVIRNAAKPISAACWYRMNAAGSTSLWSLSFHSPSPLVLSLSLSPAPSALYVPPTLLLCLSNQCFPLSFFLSLSLSLTCGSFSGEGTPRWSHESRRLLLSPAAFLPFRSSLFRCSARAFFFSLLFSLLSF